MQNSILLRVRLAWALAAPVALLAVASASVAYAAPADQATPTPDQSVSIDSFAFASGEISIPVGATLQWSNVQAGVPHTATSVDGVWDSGVLQSGNSFDFTFNQVGDFAYQCEIHPSMHGIVHVLNDATDQVNLAATTDSATPPAASATVAPLASATQVTVAPTAPTATQIAQPPAPTSTPIAQPPAPTAVPARTASTPAPYYGY